MKTRTITLLTLGGLIVLLVTMALAPPAMADLADGLKGYFAMDGTLADTSANQWNSSFTPVTWSGNPATYVAGPNGAGDQAVAITRYDSVKIGPGTTGPLTAFTFSAWVKFDEPLSTYSRIFVADINEIDVQLNSQKAEFWVNDMASYPPLRTGNIITDPNEWYYLTTTWESGSSMRIYVDGVLEAERTPGVTGTINPDTYTSIGSTSWGGSENMKGAIADAAVWTRALTPEEVGDLFANGGNPTAAAAAPELPSGLMIPIGAILIGALLWIRRLQAAK